MKKIIAVMALAIVATRGVARADHPTVGFSSDIAGPVVTIPASTLPRGMAAAILRVEYIKFDTIPDAALARYAAEGIHAHSVDYLLSPSLGVGYGVTDDLTVGLRLPYLLRTDVREGHLHEDGEAEVEQRGDSDGIGDLTLLCQYRFLNLPKARFETALLLGVKTPTGYTGARDEDGNLFEVEHQPGSGSWDPLFGIAASKRLGAVSLDGNILYTLATLGSQKTDLGDRLHYNLAASYRLGHYEVEEHHHDEGTPEHHHVHEQRPHAEVDLIFELNGEWQEKQKMDGVEDPNSGGYIVYVSPGVRVSGKGWAATFSVGLPIVEERNGVQHETTLRVVAGVSKGF